MRIAAVQPNHKHTRPKLAYQMPNHGSSSQGRRPRVVVRPQWPELIARVPRLRHRYAATHQFPIQSALRHSQPGGELTMFSRRYQSRRNIEIPS